MSWWFYPRNRVQKHHNIFILNMMLVPQTGEGGDVAACSAQADHARIYLAGKQLVLQNAITELDELFGDGEEEGDEDEDEVGGEEVEDEVGGEEVWLLM